MTQIGESIAIAIGEAIDSPSPCWFCEGDEPERKRKNSEVADPDTSAAESAEAIPENYEHNDSSTLGKKLGDAPNWTIKNPLDDKNTNNTKNTTKIVPGAHHCIPGGASLAKATDLHKFMREGEDYYSDIGYDVNHENNGVWLPGNYAVRKDASEFNSKTWGAHSPSFKASYVERAVKSAGGRQFHDAHSKYNRLCKKSLLALAAKMKLPEDEFCPVCEKKKNDKKRPPFGLVGKLDNISGEYKKMLTNPTRKSVHAGFYTSSRMKKLYP